MNGGREGREGTKKKRRATVSQFYSCEVQFGLGVLGIPFVCAWWWCGMDGVCNSFVTMYIEIGKTNSCKIVRNHENVFPVRTAGSILP